VLTLAINIVAQKEKAAVKMLWSSRRTQPQSTVCDVWSLRLYIISNQVLIKLDQLKLLKYL
jgi:hypothetical protein